MNTRRVKLLNLMLWIVAGGAGLIFLGNLLGGHTPVAVEALSPMILLLCLAGQFLLRRGFVALVSYAMLGVGFVMLTFSAAWLGTIRTPTSAGYLIVVIIAGALFERRGVVVSAALSSLALLGLFLAEKAGWLPPPDLSVTITQWIAYSLLFGVCGALTLASTVSERRAEEALRESDERLLLTLEAAHVVAWEINPVKNTHVESGPVGELFGQPEEFYHPTVANLFDSIHPEDRERVSSLIQSALRGESAYDVEYRILLPDGEVRWIAANGTLQRDQHGQPERLLGVARNVTERKRVEEVLNITNEILIDRLHEIEELQAALEEQAIRDPLSGLYNRRHMEEAIRRELARARREGYPVSIIMMDIDKFKKLNDTYGHMLGDRVIQALGNHLTLFFRKDDIVCRYGGEEFLVILHGIPAETAFQRADECRRSFAAQRVEYAGQKVVASFSAGVAVFPGDAKDMETLIQAADHALYQAKSAGRNRVERFEG